MGGRHVPATAPLHDGPATGAARRDRSVRWWVLGGLGFVALAFGAQEGAVDRGTVLAQAGPGGIAGLPLLLWVLVFSAPLLRLRE